MKTKEEIEILKADAASGDGSSQNSLGCAYASGDGVAKNLATAFYWFCLAAESGNKYGQYNTGLYYQNGYGTTKNIQNAIAHYELAANQGYGKAANALGQIYDKGYEVNTTDLILKKDNSTRIEPNPEEAFYWYKKSAYKEDIAKYNYARCYELGIGTPISKRMACRLYYSCKTDLAKKRLNSIWSNYSALYDSALIKLSLVSNNPYRILGIWSNSSIKDIKAHQGKIEALTKVGKDVTFDIDTILPSSAQDFCELYKNRIEANKANGYSISDDLAFYYDDALKLNLKDSNWRVAIDRSESSLQIALKRLSSTEEKIKYSLFWLCNATDTDSKAFSLLANKKWSEAISLWRDCGNFSALINRAFLYLIDYEFVSAAQCICNVIHNDKHRADFLSHVCPDSRAISEEDLAHIFLDALCEIPNAEFSIEGINSSPILKLTRISQVSTKYIKAKTFEKLKQKVSSALLAAESQSRDDFDKASHAYDVLARIAPYQLTKISRAIGADDYSYKLLCNDIATKLLDYAVYYNNNNPKWSAPSESLYLTQCAIKIAVDETLRERCSKNIEIFAENKKNSTLKMLSDDIKSQIEDLDNAKAVSEIANKFKDISLRLECMKSELGDDSIEYQNFSDNIVNRIISRLINICSTTSDFSNTLDANKLLIELKKQQISDNTRKRIDLNLSILSGNINKRRMQYTDIRSFKEVLKRHKTPPTKEENKERRKKKLVTTAILGALFSAICIYLHSDRIWDYYMEIAPWWISTCVIVNILIAMFVVIMWLLEFSANPTDSEQTDIMSIPKALFEVSGDTGMGYFALIFLVLGLVVFIGCLPIHLLVKLATLIK